MSSFTIGLAILGGLLLAMLVAYNTWTSRRNTPRQPEAAVAAAPLAAEDVRQDPVFDVTLAPPLPPM